MTGALSDPVYVWEMDQGGATTPAIVGTVVAVIVLLLLVAVIVTHYLRRGSDCWSEKQVRPCPLQHSWKLILPSKQVSDFDNQEYRGVSPHYTAESGVGRIYFRLIERFVILALYRYRSYTHRGHHASLQYICLS